MTASTRPPAGMPPHLWELAKRDARGAVPERIRRATDNGADAPPAVRAVARRAATASATVGVVAAAVALGAGPASAGPASAGPASAGPTVAPASFVEHTPGDVPDGPGTHVAGGPDGAHAFHHGTTEGGPVSSGLGSTFRVEHPDAPGPQHTLAISIYQDVSVVETADGNFQVDARQFIVVHDSQGHEYVFTEHYQVTVPDPPGQETDLTIHETGRVHVVENPDGSFTPVGIDHGIAVTVGSDGNGRDEVHIRQDESVRVDEHGRPDPHDTTVSLGERATSTTQDIGDPATTSIDQSTSTGVARSHPAPVGDPMVMGPATGPHPVTFSGPATSGAPPTDPLFARPATPLDPGPFHGLPGASTEPPPDARATSGAHLDPTHPDGAHIDRARPDPASTEHSEVDTDRTHHDLGTHETSGSGSGHEDTGHETGSHDGGSSSGSDGSEHLAHTVTLH